MSGATIYALCDNRIADPIQRVRYVGQTRIAVEQRLRRHWVTALAGAREHRAAWMRSVKLTGGDVVIVTLERVLGPDADAAESAHIARFRAFGCDLTNRTDGGRGRRGWDVSPETRRKMSEAAKRRGPHSAETYRKVSDTQKSSAACQSNMQKLHELNRGRKYTQEHRKRISQSLRGEKNGQNVMTWESVAQIRARYVNGAKQAQLAREFGCSPATICTVVNNQRWVAS